MLKRNSSAERRGRAHVVALCVALSVGCGSSARGPAAVSEGDDPVPVLTPAEREQLAALSPTVLPAAPKDASNRWADDAAAAAFGQKLFFDGAFSGALLDGDNDGSAFALGQQGETGRVACSGCHLPESGFADSRSVRKQISLAAGWGKRKAPSLLDVAHSPVLMWGGRHDTLYNQALGVIESPVEMNSSRLFVAQQMFLLHRAPYEEIFGAMPPLDDKSRFPTLPAEQAGCLKLDMKGGCTTPMRGAPGDGAEYDRLTPEDQAAVTRVVVNLGKALGAYQRLLSCGQGPFDRWVAGDRDALTPSQQRGAVLFVGKAECVSCHSGPFLSDEKFHNVGMRAKVVATAFLNANDRGAAADLPAAQQDPLNVMGEYSDGPDERLAEALKAAPASLEGAFRTPRLRCVSQRPSFMHTGQLQSLEDVVAFFSRGGDPGGFPGQKEIKALDLTERERADLVAFLGALDGPGPSAELMAH